MSIAYVLEQNATVNREGERLLIKKDKTVLHTLHLFKLEQLVLFGNVLLTPAAIASLLKEGIDTVFMSQKGRYRGRLAPPMGKNIPLRIEQFKRMGDADYCIEAARSIVAGKSANMRAILLRLNRSRESLGLEDRILGLKQLAQRASEAGDLDTLRGYEGRSAVIYFEGFSRGFLIDGVRFERRVRRPPTDPVNALLSLGYTLLFNTVTASVNLTGLDPFLGCLHSVEYGRPSLALDLMEEWRSVIVDSLVLSVFNMKTITLEDFILGASREDVEDEGEDVLTQPDADEPEQAAQNPPALPVRLTDAGFRKFLAQFERKMGEKIKCHLNGQQIGYRDCIREQVRHFARYVRGEEDSYRPMVLR